MNLYVSLQVALVFLSTSLSTAVVPISFELSFKTFQLWSSLLGMYSGVDKEPSGVIVISPPISYDLSCCDDDTLPPSLPILGVVCVCSYPPSSIESSSRYPIPALLYTSITVLSLNFHPVLNNASTPCSVPMFPQIVCSIIFRRR